MKTYTLESANVTDMNTFYDEVVKVFALPEHFGRNLDALFDSMCEFEWEIVVLRGFDAFEEKLWEDLAEVMDIFSDAGIEVVLEYGF